MEQMIPNIAELEEFAKKFLATLSIKDAGLPAQAGATIVGLSGELGSGKTAFVGATAQALGVSEGVLSPTFVIAKFYDIPAQKRWARLVHIDAYRIQDTSELKALRWEEILSDPKNLVLIEWPEHIGTAFPLGAPILTFRFIDERTRAIGTQS